MRCNTQSDDRPLGESKFQCYISPFADQKHRVISQYLGRYCICNAVFQFYDDMLLQCEDICNKVEIFETKMKVFSDLKC